MEQDEFELFKLIGKTLIEGVRQLNKIRRQLTRIADLLEYEIEVNDELDAT